MKKINLDSVDRLLAINSALNEIFFTSLNEDDTSRSTDSPIYNLPSLLKYAVGGKTDKRRTDYTGTPFEVVDRAFDLYAGAYNTAPKEIRKKVFALFGDPTHPDYRTAAVKVASDGTAETSDLNQGLLTLGKNADPLKDTARALNATVLDATTTQSRGDLDKLQADAAVEADNRLKHRVAAWEERERKHKESGSKEPFTEPKPTLEDDTRAAHQRAYLKKLARENPEFVTYANELRDAEKNDPRYGAQDIAGNIRAAIYRLRRQNQNVFELPRGIIEKDEELQGLMKQLEDKGVITPEENKEMQSGVLRTLVKNNKTNSSPSMEMPSETRFA